MARAFLILSENPVVAVDITDARFKIEKMREYLYIKIRLRRIVIMVGHWRRRSRTLAAV